MFTSFHCRRRDNDPSFMRIIDILKEDEILDYTFSPIGSIQDINEEIVESFKRHGKFSARTLKNMLDSLDGIGVPIFIAFATDDFFQVVDTSETDNSSSYCLESRYTENFNDNNFSYGLKSEVQEFLNSLDMKDKDSFMSYSSKRRGDFYFYIIIIM